MGTSPPKEGLRWLEEPEPPLHSALRPEGHAWMSGEQREPVEPLLASCSESQKRARAGRQGTDPHQVAIRTGVRGQRKDTLSPNPALVS